MGSLPADRSILSIIQRWGLPNFHFSACVSWPYAIGHCYCVCFPYIVSISLVDGDFWREGMKPKGCHFECHHRRLSITTSSPCTRPIMARPPPSSAYPPMHRNTPQMPPFPQLLNIKDEQPSHRASISSDPGNEYHSDEDDDNDSNASPSAANGASSSLAPKVKERKPHATRRRVVQSCSECRRRKIKCDKK